MEHSKHQTEPLKWVGDCSVQRKLPQLICECVYMAVLTALLIYGIIGYKAWVGSMKYFTWWALLAQYVVMIFWMLPVRTKVMYVLSTGFVFALAMVVVFLTIDVFSRYHDGYEGYTTRDYIVLVPYEVLLHFTPLFFVITEIFQWRVEELSRVFAPDVEARLATELLGVVLPWALLGIYAVSIDSLSLYETDASFLGLVTVGLCIPLFSSFVVFEGNYIDWW
jgi:hypothetical protein